MLIITRALYALQPARIQQTLPVSVIIAARNEEHNLPDLFTSLEALNYPKESYEIILVDDESDDDTLALMHKFAARNSNCRVLQHPKIKASLQGKKGALSYAIARCKGEIILTTDADCIVPPGWIESFVELFSPTVGMVLGHSPVRKAAGFRNLLLRFDSLCEATVAAATAYYNRPAHSNGRNLAFRREVFEEVGGYSQTADIGTGDDFFLSQIISQRTNWKFTYNTDPNSFVMTQPGPGGKVFLQQQLRRNSKAFHLTPLYFSVAAWIFLFHLALVLLLLLPGHAGILGIMLGAKFLFEYLPVRKGALLFQQERLLPGFPLMWIVYPFFIIGFGLLGSLQLYRWK